MTKDEQARARLVEIALKAADMWPHMTVSAEAYREKVRRAAGLKNPRKGHWCAAGLTAAMEDAGLVAPAPGTPARRGAVALLDWVVENESPRFFRSHPQGNTQAQYDSFLGLVEPGDIIAWLQHPPGKDPAGWRRGHVALIVAMDDESITTVGWNEGNAPGRVMKRKLWRDPSKKCTACNGRRQVPGPQRGMGGGLNRDCATCKGTGKVQRSSTVLYRKPTGMLYGIARPVAR